jgi:hypothetical protein
MWYKGTKQDCEDYNTLVTVNENYSGITNIWSNIYEINGEFYISYNEKYVNDNLILINESPFNDDFLINQ